MKKLLPVVLALIVLLAACGPNAEPTIDAASVQASAVAMAFTMSAQTQAAQPTATPVPPTETPTLTPLPSPTFNLPTLPASMPTATQASTDPCNQLFPADSPGKRTNLRITNETKYPVTLSLWLSMTPHGVCGFAPNIPTLSRNQQIIIEVLQGCYTFSAYTKDAWVYTNGCMNNTDLWMLYIRMDSIVLKSP